MIQFDKFIQLFNKYLLIAYVLSVLLGTGDTTRDKTSPYLPRFHIRVKANKEANEI